MEISPPRDMGIIRLSGRVIADVKIFSILVFVYSLLLYATPVGAQEDLSDLYKKVAPSVVRIAAVDTEGKLKSGTGFFTREDGILVTNYHIIENYVEAGAKLSNGEVIPIERIIAEDREGDWVLLKLRAKGRSFPTLKITDTKIEPGQRILVIGSPFGLEGTISDGIISAIREIPGVGKRIQITAPISPGSSGSPVLNIKGEVVGVATASFREGQSLNFAISVEKINSLLYKKAVNGLSATDWFEKGDVLRHAGKWQEAIEAYTRVIALDPKDAWAYIWRGITYGKLKNYSEMIRDLDYAIHLDPKEDSPYFYRAIAYREFKDYHRMIKDLDKAIELNPNSAVAYNARGSAYGSLGDHRQAIKNWDMAIQLEPENATNYHNRGSSYAQIGDYQRAIKDYDKAIELDPNFAMTYIFRANVYIELKNYRKVIKDLDKAIELYPEYDPIYYRRGKAYGNLGDHGKEIEDYKNAARLGHKPAQDLLRSKGISW